MQFLETLLLPEVHKPHPFVFFKVIKDDPFDDTFDDTFGDILMKIVYVSPKDHYSPIRAQVASVNIFDNRRIVFLVKTDDKEHLHDVDTDDYYIMEEDKIDRVRNTNVEIGDQAENELIQLMKQYPSIKKKIPHELKHYPSFKKKVDAEITKGRMKSTNRTSEIHPKLSDLERKLINEMLGIKTDPNSLHAERREQTRRIISEPTPEPEPAPKCKGSNCSISGGKRKRNRTRKNKKKRYGRL